MKTPLLFLILGLSIFGGCNDYYEVKPAKTPAAVPKTEDELRYHTMTSGNYQFNCAIVEAGKIKCWGENAWGQLGDGSAYVSSATPVYVQGIDNAVSLAGGDYSSCALLATGKVKCWGENNGNQLGIGPSVLTKTNVPLEVSNLSDVVAIEGSDAHYCALLKDRTMKCWGDNGYGQLGDGTANASTAPIAVIGVDSVRSIAVNSSTSCAVMYTGKVKCWGLNRYGGASGSGVAGWQWYTPTDIPSIENAISVSGMQYTTCTLLSDRTISCWGRNFAGVTNTLASDVPGFEDSNIVSGGFGHFCALKDDSKVFCVGYNGDGRVGDGTFVSPTTPVEVVGLPVGEITELQGGDESTCVRLANSKMYCWGNNSKSQLGDQTTTNRNTPVEVLGL